MWNSIFSCRKWQDRCSAGMVNHQILHGHCLQKRELWGKMTAFWITPLLVRWIKHGRGPAGATADSNSRLELWEVGVSSTLGENGVWLTMASMLLCEQQVKPEQLKWHFSLNWRFQGRRSWTGCSDILHVFAKGRTKVFLRAAVCRCKFCWLKSGVGDPFQKTTAKS